MTEDGQIKVKVQATIVSISVLLMAGKFLAFYLTNSVGILTDALESIVNVTAGFISLYSIRYAIRPKDSDHPFGHGKIELISASIEGLLIIGAGTLIILEGIKRIFSPVEVEKLDIGILLIAIAGLINYLMGWYSIRIGKKYDSIALVAGGKHLQSDTYSTIGLVLGLVLLYVTKIGWIDGALALIFGSIIIVTGVRILKKTVDNLLDKADESTIKRMSEIISKHQKEDWIDVHNLKMIKYGNIHFIDCDLTLPWYYNIIQGHNACDELKACIVKNFEGQAIVSIHTDPCNTTMCSHCPLLTCEYRKASFQSPLAFTQQELTQSDEDRKEE